MNPVIESDGRPAVFRIGLAQMRVGEEPAANLARAVELIGEAAGRGARVVCLPELFRTPYFCQREDAALFDLAEPVPGPSTAALAAAARRHGVVVVASLFERRAPGIYHNTAAVIDADGSLAGVYRKMHIPDDPAYYEKYYFTPGDLGFRPVDTSVGRIGVLVCWDQWFPEAARLTALAGAELILLPDGHRLASRRKAGRGRSAARRLAHRAARSRDRQRRLRRGRQPRRPRAAGQFGRGARVLGHLVLLRPAGGHARRGADAGRGGPRRRDRAGRASRRSGATGRSCAIGASTPTAGSHNASWTTRPPRNGDSDAPQKAPGARRANPEE